MANKEETTTTTTTLDENTTTTTTEAPETTTTTTDVPETTTTTTVDHQGEVEVDKGARADVLGPSNPEADAQAQHDNIEGAKQSAMENHAAEHAEDGVTGDKEAV